MCILMWSSKIESIAGQKGSRQRVRSVLTAQSGCPKVTSNARVRCIIIPFSRCPVAAAAVRRRTRPRRRPIPAMTSLSDCLPREEWAERIPESAGAGRPIGAARRSPVSGPSGQNICTPGGLGFHTILCRPLPVDERARVSRRTVSARVPRPLTERLAKRACLSPCTTPRASFAGERLNVRVDVSSRVVNVWFAFTKGCRFYLYSSVAYGDIQTFV